MIATLIGGPLDGQVMEREEPTHVIDVIELENLGVFFEHGEEMARLVEVRTLRYVCRHRVDGDAAYEYVGPVVA